MTKRLILMLAVMLTILAGESRTVRDFFASEPGDVFTLLTKTTRLDMIDYYDNGTVVAASNNMAGTSQIDTITNEYLRIQVSDAKTVELRLMQWKSDTIIAVIETVKTPVKDSRITFYNKHWYALKEIKPFKMPTMDDFILPTVKKNQRKELLQQIAFPLIELTFGGPDFEQLTARHGLAEFLGQEEWARLKPYLRPTLTYRIQNGKIK
ncbi:MAG: DUF3256 family protein [Muribaculaceae bacterium]|nr:DUF3256 family protein [Muribaculaceae bacterium]MBR1474860.1 DUF3256 family protein [Muribaculaceae bacterium]